MVESIHTVQNMLYPGSKANSVYILNKENSDKIVQFCERFRGTPEEFDDFTINGIKFEYLGMFTDYDLPFMINEEDKELMEEFSKIEVFLSLEDLHHYKENYEWLLN